MAKLLPSIAKNTKREKVSIKASMRTIMRAIAAPTTGPTVRWASVYEADQTAIASPYAEVDQAWPSGTTSTTSRALNPDEMMIVKRRDPSCSTIEYDVNTSGDTAQYNFTFVNNENGGTTAPVLQWKPLLIGEAEVEPPVACLQIAAGQNWSPDGPTSPVGRHQQMKSAFWQDNGTVLNVALAGLTSGQTVECIQYFLQNNEWIKAGVITLSVGSPIASLSPPNGQGYYTVTFHQTAGSTEVINSSITMNLTISGSRFAHKPMKSVLQAGASLGPIRSIGSAVQYTNTTAPNFATGSVIGVQVPNSTQWFTLTSFAVIGGLDKAKLQQFDAKKGIYGFIRPSDQKDFDYYDSDFMFDGLGNLVKLSFSIVPKSPIIILFVKGGEGATSQSGKWISYDAIEFLTTNQLYNLASPLNEPEEFQAAVSATKKIAQFHENPLHLKEIGGAIAKVAELIMKYGPMVMQGAETIGSMIGG